MARMYGHATDCCENWKWLTDKHEVLQREGTDERGWKIVKYPDGKTRIMFCGFKDFTDFCSWSWGDHRYSLNVTIDSESQITVHPK